jgi:hypothetical protein
MFLIYMEPLLRWLHAGNKGYMHDHADTSTPNNKPKTALAAGLLRTTLSVSLAPTQTSGSKP